ncbi:MAG: ribosome biogenesis GTP-binding protein YihA/YsxC [Ilumatobacteraceae bacterium]
MTRPLQISFVTSAASVHELPHSPAEVAIVGRSNVGKSSLINSLANQKHLAKVSKTPGRTQLINLFANQNEETLVDLPGYGFASVSGKIKRGWENMIMGYLREREELQMVFLLVDGEIGPTKLDLLMLENLRAIGIAHTIVATKQDKVGSSKRDSRKRELAAGCEVGEKNVVWVSTSTGAGIARLRSIVNACLGGNADSH